MHTPFYDNQKLIKKFKVIVDKKRTTATGAGLHASLYLHFWSGQVNLGNFNFFITVNKLVIDDFKKKINTKY